jgi:ferredoxin-NADP reductase
MAFRPVEGLYWVQDVWEHVRVSRRRNSLRKPGRGVDYTDDRFTGYVKSIVDRYQPKEMKLEVVEIIEETPSTKTFRLKRVDDSLPPFRPGQYLNVFVDVDGVLTSRPYSISSSPGGDALDLTVQHKPGGFVTRYLLNELKVGDELKSTGPTGHFYYEPLIDGKDLVFLAGGSGITPFMSMIRTLLDEDHGPKIQLIYGSRTQEDVIFGEILSKLADEHDALDYSLVISEPPEGYSGLSGFLDGKLIHDQVGEIEGKTFFICGPNVMYDLCLMALEALGVPPHRIRREVYGPPEDVTQEPGWPEGLSAETVFQVEVQGYKTIGASAGEPLMNALERHGIAIRAVCRSGECSACRLRLLSGKVFMPSQTALRESDPSYGYIHPCVAYPIEDLVICI